MSSADSELLMSQNSDSSMPRPSLGGRSLSELKRAELQSLLRCHGLKGGSKKTQEMVAILEEHFEMLKKEGRESEAVVPEPEEGAEEEVEEVEELEVEVNGDGDAVLSPADTLLPTPSIPVVNVSFPTASQSTSLSVLPSTSTESMQTLILSEKDKEWIEKMVERKVSEALEKMKEANKLGAARKSSVNPTMTRKSSVNVIPTTTRKTVVPPPSAIPVPRAPKMSMAPGAAVKMGLTKVKSAPSLTDLPPKPLSAASSSAGFKARPAPATTAKPSLMPRMNSTHSLVSGTSAPSGKAAPAKPAPTVPKSALSHGKHATSTSHIRFGGELSDKIGKHVPPTPAIRGKPGAASKPNLPDLGKWDNQLQTESEREMKAKQLAAAKADSLERKIRIRKTSRSPSRPVSTEPAVLSEEQEPEGLMDEDSVEDEKSVALAPVSEKGSVQASLERLEF